MGFCGQSITEVLLFKLQTVYSQRCGLPKRWRRTLNAVRAEPPTEVKAPSEAEFLSASCHHFLYLISSLLSLQSPDTHVKHHKFIDACMTLETALSVLLNKNFDDRRVSPLSLALFALSWQDDIYIHNDCSMHIFCLIGTRPSHVLFTLFSCLWRWPGREHTCSCPKVHTRYVPLLT